MEIRRAWVKRIAWTAILVGVLLIVVWGVLVAWTGLSLRKHMGQALALADSPEDVDPAAACALIGDLRVDVVNLDRVAGGLVHLAPLFGWLPGIGGDLVAAPHLLDAADGSTEAGALTCEALLPSLDSLVDGAEAPSLEQVTQMLADARPELGQALAAVERAQVAWAQVDLGQLSPGLADRLALLDEGLPLVQMGLEMAIAAPDLLGVDGPRTYLVLAMNEDERRPVMGYITGVGEVRLEQGQLVQMAFRDGYSVDDFTQPYPVPPEPMTRYMGIELWVFRDSNWSTDFPTSARRAISLYRPGYGVTVDGVIALDQQAVQRLVDALGPLQVEGAEAPVTGETLIAYMRQAWAPDEGTVDAEWWKQRKSFMGPLAQAAWQRIEEGDVTWVPLGRVLLRLFEERHLLVYLEHPDAAAVLAEMGWDGALVPGPGDFLMVVDTSVGYNRASARVRQEIDYRVDLAGGLPQASLTLAYTHTSAVDYPCVREIRYDLVYEQMMDRCYWDYVQVYVPQGSQLVDATRIPIASEALFSGEGVSGEVMVRTSEEGPWEVFSVLGLLPTGATQTRSFDWTLPTDMVQWVGEDDGRYFLRVQKQSGTSGHPLTVRIRLPEGTVLLDASPEPSAVDKGWIIYQVVLDRDWELRLDFRR